jgi:ADP-heptose:LPS heptosyltransferase
MACYAQTWGDTQHLVDMAGQTSISELTGLLAVCDVVVSTDSGPYHMAVAMQKPTLVWFTYPEQTSFHDEPWCARLIQPEPELFASTFAELIKRPRWDLAPESPV